MQLFRIIFIVVNLSTLSGCSSTMVNVFEEDLTNPYGFSGGTFNYLDQGADFVIQQRIQDGMEQAKRICAGKEVHLLGEKREVFSGVIDIPVTQTAQHQGTVSNGYNSASYSGTTTYNAYQSMPYSTVRKGVTFICMDTDRAETLYSIILPKEGAPVCKNLPEYNTAGKYRLEIIATSASSDDCRSEGWIRYLAKDNKKAHLFIGENGKQKCKQIENKLIEQQVNSSDVNLWLRKNLKCSEIKDSK